MGGALANDNHRGEADVHTDDAPGCAHVSAGVQPGGHPDAPVPQSAHVSASARRPANTRAKQTIPPALRRAILLRDQRRCRVPGCRNARFLDVHHIELRSEGGPNAPENLLTLCSVHHRASHRGKLLIEGSATPGLRYSHADGRAYGEAIAPSALEAQTKTFGALRTLGFRETEVRAFLAKLRGQSDPRNASAEQWLRAALACLTRPRARP